MASDVQDRGYEGVGTRGAERVVAGAMVTENAKKGQTKPMMCCRINNMNSKTKPKRSQ